MSDGPFHRSDFEPALACLALVDENTSELLMDLAAVHAEVANRRYRSILAQGVRVWRTKLMNVRPGWIADAHLWCEVQSEATGEAGIVINIEEVKP